MDDLFGLRQALSANDFAVVIPLGQVVAIRLVDPDVYQQMNPAGASEREN